MFKKSKLGRERYQPVLEVRRNLSEREPVPRMEKKNCSNFPEINKVDREGK